MKLVQEEKKPTRWEGWQEGWVWGSWIAHSALLSQSVPSELLQGQIKKDLRLPWLNSLEWTSVSACSQPYPPFGNRGMIFLGQEVPVPFTAVLWGCWSWCPSPPWLRERCDQQSQSHLLFFRILNIELSWVKGGRIRLELIHPGGWVLTLKKLSVSFALLFLKLPSFTRSDC